MKVYRASDMTRNVGDLLEAATIGPVAITKHRKPRFVLMSMARYEALRSGPAQRAVDITDMPEELGKLLDEAIEEQLRDD